MCDEFVKAYNKLKNDVSGDDKKYVEEANVYIIRRRNRGDEFYEWKRYDEVRFYKNYDYVYERIGYYHKGQRKLDKEIRVSGLPEHCYK